MIEVPEELFDNPFNEELFTDLLNPYEKSDFINIEGDNEDDDIISAINFARVLHEHKVLDYLKKTYGK